MKDLFSEVVDKFEIYQLVDIYEINSLKLQGFRVRGASSVAKTQRMKTNLKNDSKISDVLKKSALYYREKKGKDFSWTLVSKLDIKIVEEKIKETNFGEVALALIDAGKLEKLEPLLTNNVKIGPDSDSAKTDKKNQLEIVKVNDDINELREIIEKLENKKNQLTNNLDIKREELKKEKEEIKRLNDKLKNAERKLDIASENSKDYLNELALKNKEISKIEGKLEEIALGNIAMEKALEESKQTKVLFLGTKYYQRYIDAKVKDNKKISYIYITDIIDFEDYHIFEKAILLAFTMNKSEVQKVLNLEELSLFKDTYNLIFIESLEEFNEYINKVGQLDE